MKIQREIREFNFNYNFEFFFFRFKINLDLVASSGGLSFLPSSIGISIGDSFATFRVGGDFSL
jgi:hypothetical protein